MARKTGHFACAHCNKHFSRMEHLVRHLRCSHEGRKDFRCALCPSAFGRSDELLRHLRGHVRRGHLCEAQVHRLRAASFGVSPAASASAEGAANEGVRAASEAPSERHSGSTGVTGCDGSRGAAAPCSPPLSPGFLPSLPPLLFHLQAYVMSAGRIFEHAPHLHCQHVLHHTELPPPSIPFLPSSPVDHALSEVPVAVEKVLLTHRRH